MTAADDGFEELIRRAQRSDREAFGELYRRTFRPVYRYCAARTGTTALAEELTQEVFMAALTGIDRLHAVHEAGVLAWLFQIARHKHADALRRQYRHPTAPLEAAGDVPGVEPAAVEALLSGDERAEVRRALEQLTPEQREVIVCKYVLGYDNAKVAGILGKNTNAVNQLHHRALASLRRLLTSEVSS